MLVASYLGGGISACMERRVRGGKDRDLWATVKPVRRDDDWSLQLRISDWWQVALIEK